jgi:transposase-like protein
MKRKNYNTETKYMAKAMYLRGDSFREIARAIGCTHMAVSKWCRDENWADYRDKIYAESSEIVATKAKDILSNMQAQKLTAYQMVLQKGLEELPQVKAASTREAVHLIETGFKGLPSTEQVAVHRKFIDVVGKIIFSELTDEGTKQRIAQRLREVTEPYSEADLIKPTERNNTEAKN